MSVVKLLSRIVAPSDLMDDEIDKKKRGTRVSISVLHDHTYGITSDPLTQFACVLSALIHDADHPGVPNAQVRILPRINVHGCFANGDSRLWPHCLLFITVDQRKDPHCCLLQEPVNCRTKLGRLVLGLANGPSIQNSPRNHLQQRRRTS